MSLRSALAAALLLTLAGCASGQGLTAPDLESRVEVDNPELRAAKADLGIEPCPSPADLAGSGSDLPALTLPCLGGGRAVTLSDVQGPAVISLWASWCGSCPDELPLYSRLSKAAGDRLTVLGVDYEDTQPGAALTLLGETGARFPQVADPGGSLSEEYRLTGLPGMLLVDAQGKVTFLLRLVDDYPQLAALVKQHTGVDVTAG